MVRFNPVTYNRNIHRDYEYYTQNLIDVLDEVKLFKAKDYSLASAIASLMQSIIVNNLFIVKTKVFDKIYILGFIPTVHRYQYSYTEYAESRGKYHNIYSRIFDDSVRISNYDNSSGIQGAGVLFADATNFDDELIEDLPTIYFDQTSIIERCTLAPQLRQIESMVLIAMLKACVYRIYGKTEHYIIFKDACCGYYSDFYGQVVNSKYMFNTDGLRALDGSIQQLVLPLKLTSPIIGLHHIASKNTYESNNVNLLTTVRLVDSELVRTAVEQILYQSMFNFKPDYEFSLIKSTNTILQQTANEFI